MSFIHHTIVGHFEPETLNAENIFPSAAIDESAVVALLTQFPSEVADNIELLDGYVKCRWAGASPASIGQAVYEFARTLAERESCIAAELPYCAIEYPESARLAQAKAQEFFRTRTPLG